MDLMLIVYFIRCSGHSKPLPLRPVVLLGRDTAPPKSFPRLYAQMCISYGLLSLKRVVR